MRMAQLLNAKLLPHLLLWMLFVVLWSVWDLIYDAKLLKNLYNNSLASVLFLALLLANRQFAIPLVLEKRQYGVYGILLLLAFLLLTNATAYLLFFAPDTHSNPAFYLSLRGKVVLATGNGILYLLSMAIYFLQKSYRREQLMQELQRRNLEVELDALRSQINPHLVFNVLNSIYFTIQNQPEQAKELVLQFSELLNYQLYDSQKERVALQQEVQYLQQYMQLEQFRQQDIVSLETDLEITDDSLPTSCNEDWMQIEQIFARCPLVFFPFLNW